jgi:uncharacterized protein (DUF58 family)
MRPSTRIRPTLRAVLLFAASLPLGFILLAWDRDLWAFSLNFGFFALVAVIVDALMGVPFNQLKVTIETPPRLFVGVAGDINVGLEQTGRFRPVAYELIAEYRGEIDPPGLVRATAALDGRTDVTLALQPRRRGVIDVDAVWLRWKGPMGLTERVVRQPLDRKIDVLTDIRGIQSAALQFFSRDAIGGVKVQQQKGDGSEFESLRDHAAGLDNRFIDWKRSAKHRKLLSKEFRIEQNHQIIMAFDTGHLMVEPIDGIARLDRAIASGLLLAWISLRNGDHVGSFGFDDRVRQYIQPSQGLPWFAHLQRATARLSYHSEETNFTLGLAELNQRLKRRALIVLFTEFIDTVTAELLLESMQRIANRHAVVFVTLRDPKLEELVNIEPQQFQAAAEAVVAYDLMRDRSIVLERLERMGVHCLDVSVKSLSVALINRYLMIKDRGLI